jgi:hypothetical protein
MAGNRCYYASQNVLKSKTVSQKAKLNVYKTIIRPVVTYGSEIWTLTKKEVTDQYLGKKGTQKYTCLDQ